MRRYSTITPAQIDATDAHRSTGFNDYYFSITDPIGERQTIFIEGNDLLNRFHSIKPNQTIRIGEVGFATGLTFLVAYDQFLKIAPQNARLQWISTERHPMGQTDLSRALDALPSLLVCGNSRTLSVMFGLSSFQRAIGGFFPMGVSLLISITQILRRYFPISQVLSMHGVLMAFLQTEIPKYGHLAFFRRSLTTHIAKRHSAPLALPVSYAMASAQLVFL